MRFRWTRRSPQSSISASTSSSVSFIPSSERYSIIVGCIGGLPMARILIPLPDRDFDVTEVAVPWRLLTRAGHDVTFCTEKGGAPPAAAPLLLTGVIFGQLGAEPEACRFYRELEHAPEFRTPTSWETVD